MVEVYKWFWLFTGKQAELPHSSEAVRENSETVTEAFTFAIIVATHYHPPTHLYDMWRNDPPVANLHSSSIVYHVEVTG
ncbi:MAG: hypothetical protein WBB19_10375 [Desulforhopalus sp.]